MNILNEYQKQYPSFGDTPKSVIAAVAFSLAMRLCVDDADDAKTLLRSEWQTLFDNGNQIANEKFISHYAAASLVRQRTRIFSTCL